MVLASATETKPWVNALAISLWKTAGRVSARVAESGGISVIPFGTNGTSPWLKVKRKKPEEQHKEN